MKTVGVKLGFAAALLVASYLTGARELRAGDRGAQIVGALCCGGHSSKSCSQENCGSGSVTTCDAGTVGECTEWPGIRCPECSWFTQTTCSAS
jgi:hypothetical protein